MSYNIDKAWVITEDGLFKLFGPDGKEIMMIKNISMDANDNHFPYAKIELQVNVGSRVEMEKFITENDNLTKTQSQTLIDRLRKNGLLPKNENP
jgi:hypothetical protein